MHPYPFLLLLLLFSLTLTLAQKKSYQVIHPQPIFTDITQSPLSQNYNYQIAINCIKKSLILMKKSQVKEVLKVQESKNDYQIQYIIAVLAEPPKIPLSYNLTIQNNEPRIKAMEIYTL